MTLASDAAPPDLGPLDPADHLSALLSPSIARADGPAPAPRHRRFLDALGVATYITDAEGRITYFNDAAAGLWGRRPDLGETWCGSWRLYWTDGRPMDHAECPMAIALREHRPVRGYEAVAERPDGGRVNFVPYPTPLYDDEHRMIGAVNVLVDVTERRRAEDALRATAEALAASSAVKDEFLGLISHELRTPVTTIFGNAHLLRGRGDRLPQETRVQMAGDIADDAERLLGIVENMLLLTRLGSGSSADLEPQMLNHVVRRQVRAYRARHPRRRVTVRSVDEPLVVEADLTYLDALLQNLINNADKYSPARASIDVRIYPRDGYAHVAVRDRGIGFDESETQKLFSPFYRGEAARVMGNGVGIGLAVCRRLAEALGGQLWANARRGGGSEFGFRLPLSGAAE